MTALPISERLQQSIEARIQASADFSARRAATMERWRIFHEQLTANRALIGFSASANKAASKRAGVQSRAKIVAEFQAIAAARAKAPRAITERERRLLRHEALCRT